MNTQLNGTQSDIKRGAIALAATADLTGLENRLVKISNSSGTAKFALPAAVGDLALFILMSGDVAANDNWAEIPTTNENARVRLNGTCVPGDLLILCDPSASSGVNAGKVEAYAAQTAGPYFAIGIAEEAGVDEQNVRFRYAPRILPYSTAFSSATPASTGASNSTPYGFTTSAQADAIVANVRDMRAFMVAMGWKATS